MGKAFKADKDSIIIATGATIKGFDELAEATNNSKIDLTNVNSEFQPKKKPESWDQTVLGKISLGLFITILGGIIVYLVTKI